MKKLLYLLPLAFAACGTPAPSTSETPTADSLPAAHTYVLVHGAWADMHAWDAVKPLLEASGNKVIAVNLPGHGADTTRGVTLNSYVDAVANAINAQPGKVALVGHSMAGMAVSAVAERIPEKLEKVVYVAAYLPRDGDSLLTWGNSDTTSLVGHNMVFAPDYSSATIKTDLLAAAICADCPQPVKDAIVQYHKAEPLAAFAAKVALSADKFGSVPKYYIHTAEDRAVTYALQQRMVAANGHVAQVYTLHTGHLPFLSQPQEFVKILTSIP
jgi:pimeloyl-ACP methyl ester carboxylesterase